MDISPITIIIALLAGIALIILLSTRYKVHPFFSLLLACILTGTIAGLELTAILGSMKEGFGKIMTSLGFIIVLGTALGLVLQANGATTAMANAIIKWVGRKRSVFSMSLTGFIVGLPIFCDSGYVVLNGLNKSMIKKTAIPTAIMSTAMATGLYAVHCLIPPHPGVTAAVGTIDANFGKVILYGLLVAIPAMLAGYFWSVNVGKKFPDTASATKDVADIKSSKLPGTFVSFVPVVVPILLIALSAIFSSTSGKTITKILIVGDPTFALAIGLLLALLIPHQWQKNELQKLMHDGLEKAGGILVIIGAGAAFGMVINSLNIQQFFTNSENLSYLGLFFPFLITVILKTAQGSSTVAIITASSIVLPFLPELHLDSENGKVLAVLAMGAGSMAVSHVNDAYFWVITNFSGQEIKPVLRVYSTASVLMAVVSMLFVYLLSLILV